MFRNKDQLVDLNIFRDYEILLGIEEEFLIIHENGTLVNAADDIMRSAAKILSNNKSRLRDLQLRIRALDPEPSPTQIEYVTLPLEPHLLREAIVQGRKLIVDAAKQIDGVRILAQSLHPIQSDPNPMCGTHINVSIKKRGVYMSAEEMAYVNNYLWNNLPELMALSANSPYYLGEITKIKSNRYVKSTVIKPNVPAQLKVPKQQAALIPMHYYGRDRYTLRIGSDESEKRVQTNRKGDRLVDITPRGPFTNIDADKDQSPKTNRVEIRIFDIQHDVGNLLNLAYLVGAAAIRSVHLLRSGKDIKLDPYHTENMQRAVYHGMKSTLIRNKHEITAISSLKSWINTLKPYLDIIGVKFEELYFQKKEKQLEPEKLSIAYKTKKIEQVRSKKKGKTYAVVQFGRGIDVVDRYQRRYRINKGSKIQGILTASYELDYDKDQTFINHIKGLRVTNYLEVQGMKIPLTRTEKVMSVMSERDQMNQRLFGRSFF